MEKLKSLKTGCLLPVAIIVGGLLFYFVGTTYIAPRFSAASTCLIKDGCLYTAINGNRSVKVVGFSADGTRFLTDGSADAIIHDATNDGKKVTGLDVDREEHGYTISGDRTQIVAHRKDSVKFFDWDGELLHTWMSNPEVAVRDVALVPLVDGLVTADKYGVALWYLSDGTLITRLLESDGIMDVTASADGEYVAAYNFMDDVIFVWPLQNLDNTLTIAEVDALTLHLNADGSQLAAGGPGGGYVWDTADGTLIAALEPDGQKATATGLSQDGSLLAVGFENGLVTVIDVDRDELVATFEHDHPPRHIAFTPDNTGLAVGLAFDVEISGGELTFRPRPDNQFQPGALLRTSENRQTVEPGYAIVWALEK